MSEWVDTVRIPSGIVGLDMALDGGFPLGSTVGVIGAAGTGKTAVLRTIAKTHPRASDLRIQEGVGGEDRLWLKSLDALLLTVFSVPCNEHPQVESFGFTESEPLRPAAESLRRADVVITLKHNRSEAKLGGWGSYRFLGMILKHREQAYGKKFGFDIVARGTRVNPLDNPEIETGALKVSDQAVIYNSSMLIEADPDVQAARDFAVVHHKGQLYDHWPYVKHLDEVAEIVRPFGSEAMILAYLHDMEDVRDMKSEMLVRHFRDRMAFLVSWLSDPSFGSRSQKKPFMSEHFKITPVEYLVALIVKAADRLANMRYSVKTRNSKKLNMYLAEHEEFRYAVYRPGLCDSIWNEIDTIVDSHIRPRI